LARRATARGIGFDARIAADTKHRQTRVIPGATHFVPMEHPDVVARMALDFFSAK
jgi:pimeloyl-ACP methyl ester carboxylesterase